MQSARELVSRVYEKSPYIIDENILHDKGLMFIGGAPKSYKSFVLNTLCMHLATGTPLFGAYRKKARETAPAFRVQKPYRILLFEQEIGDFSLKDRLLPLADTLEELQRSLFLDNVFTHSCDRSLRLDNPEGAAAIGKIIEEVKPDIVIFDPLVEFHHGDENSTQDMSRVMRGVDWIRDRYNVAVIMSHHCGKATELRSGADALRGSSAIFGKGDSYFMLTVHNRGAGIMAVEPTLRRGIPIRRFLIKLDWSGLNFKFVDWATTKSTTDALKEVPVLTDLEQ